MKKGILPAVLAGLLLVDPAAHAGDHVYKIDSPVCKAECTSCHLAYPPQLLSAPDWRRLLSGLDRHFGTDASVDAKALEALSGYLELNAGRKRAATGIDSPRITTSTWFIREHRKLPDTTWRSAAVGKASNCVACHTAADPGDFSERTRRVPVRRQP